MFVWRTSLYGQPESRPHASNPSKGSQKVANPPETPPFSHCHPKTPTLSHSFRPSPITPNLLPEKTTILGAFRRLSVFPTAVGGICTFADETEVASSLPPSSFHSRPVITGNFHNSTPNSRRQVLRPSLQWPTGSQMNGYGALIARLRLVAFAGSRRCTGR